MDEVSLEAFLNNAKGERKDNATSVGASAGQVNEQETLGMCIHPKKKKGFIIWP